jgi:hypothetical protein
MAETFRSRIMEEADVRRALARIAHEIIERNGKEQELCLLGVELMEARLLYSTTIFGFIFWTMYGYLMGEAA